MQFRGNKVQEKKRYSVEKRKYSANFDSKKIAQKSFLATKNLVLFFLNIILQSILIGKILFKLNFFMYTIDK